MTAPEMNGWAAWVDRMPGGDGPTLHVTATCTFPTSGYTAELVPADPQAEGLDDFRLRLVVHEPDGPVLDALTDVDVTYAGPAAQEYATVTVTMEVVAATIPVESVE
jgi:hypothetical protein